MIDSHCHFDLPAFKNQHAKILKECAANGISRLLVPGLGVEQFSLLLALQAQSAVNAQSAQLDIALGLHPYFIEKLEASAFNMQVEALYEHAKRYEGKYVAMGECGLDSTLAIDMAYQEKVLNTQIEIAMTLQKPLILHHRQSHNALIRALKHYQFAYGGVIHAFSGSLQIAHTYIEMGFALGVGGTITYDRAIKTRQTISKIPLQHLLLETDAPDMPLHGYQGQPNTPLRLPIIAKTLADLQQVSLAHVSQQTNKNYFRIFID